MEATEAVRILMQGFIAQQQVKEEDAGYMLHIFTDMTGQAAAYQLWLTPDVRLNAQGVRALLEQHHDTL